MMNSFATIYFHNYLRLDEMPVPVSSQIDKVSGLKSPDINSANCDGNSEISQIPSSVKYNIDGKNNHGRHDLMDSIVTIKMNGKEHPKGNIRMIDLTNKFAFQNKDTTKLYMH